MTDRYGNRLAALRAEADRRGLDGDETVTALLRLAGDLHRATRLAQAAADGAADEIDAAWRREIDARLRLMTTAGTLRATAEVARSCEPFIPADAAEHRQRLADIGADVRLFLAHRLAGIDPDYVGPAIAVSADGRVVTLGQAVAVAPGDRVALFVSTRHRQETP